MNPFVSSNNKSTQVLTPTTPVSTLSQPHQAIESARTRHYLFSEPPWAQDLGSSFPSHIGSALSGISSLSPEIRHLDREHRWLDRFKEVFHHQIGSGGLSRIQPSFAAERFACTFAAAASRGVLLKGLDAERRISLPNVRNLLDLCPKNWISAPVLDSLMPNLNLAIGVTPIEREQGTFLELARSLDVCPQRFLLLSGKPSEILSSGVGGTDGIKFDLILLRPSSFGVNPSDSERIHLLRQCGELLSDDGRIVIRLPDSRRAHVSDELLSLSNKLSNLSVPPSRMTRIGRSSYEIPMKKHVELHVLSRDHILELVR